MRSIAVARWRCCAVRCGSRISDAVAQCAVDRGSKMRIEDQGSVALLFALCEREREGKRVRTLKSGYLCAVSLLRSGAIARRCYCAVSAVAQWRCCDARAQLRTLLRSDAVAQRCCCAARCGSRIEDEDRRSRICCAVVALCKREREGKRMRTLK